MAVELPNPSASTSSPGAAEPFSARLDQPPPRAPRSLPAQPQADPHAHLLFWLLLLTGIGCILAGLLLLAGAGIKLALALLAYVWLMSMAIMAAD